MKAAQHNSRAAFFVVNSTVLTFANQHYPLNCISTVIMNNYEWLIGKLDAFIRKYYANRLIRGTLVFLSSLLFYFVSVSLGEYYLYLPVWAKISLVGIFISLGISALTLWIILPLLKMSKLGKTISHQQAAEIIGNHFPEVSDKLLNILQLKGNVNSNSTSIELVEASINQKINQISVVPIQSAIDLTVNRKYLKFLLPPLAAIIVIFIVSPNILKESTVRLLQPTKPFEKPAPFSFLLDSKSLVAVRNSDYTIEVSMAGKALPAEAAIELGDDLVSMQSIGTHKFKYTFRNVTESFKFRILAGGYFSTEYTLKVIQRPILKAFKIDIEYPSYIGRKNETKTSLGDMTVPAGTKLNWALETAHTNKADIRLGLGMLSSLQNSNGKFNFSYSFKNDTTYTLILTNSNANASDSFKYNINIIPDQYPVIQCRQIRDTLTGKQVLISGNAGDDYKISKVVFTYQIQENNKVILSKSITLASKNSALVPFEHYLDIQSIRLKPGQKVNYFIEAWDNDGVNGPKSSRSEMMSYQMFDAEQLDSAINKNAEQISAGISSSAEKTKQLQNDYKEAQNKLLQNKNLDWQMEQAVQEMMEKQEELKNQVENIKERFEEQMQQSEQKNYSNDLKEKQQELNKQLNNLLNEELKKQMEKLQELMQKLTKEQAVEAMKQLEQENKLFNMDMNRMQELMKKLEMQMRMEDMANKLDILSKEQNDLAQKTEKNIESAEKLSNEQKDLKDKLEQALKEDLKKAQDLAKETKQKDRLENEEQMGKETEKEMDDSQQKLDDKKNSESKKNQDKATENLKKMAQQLRDKAAGMDMEQIEIDIKATRQILSNLIRLSFAQEDLIDKVRKTPTSSQNYITNMDEQNRLHRNSQMIRDSLFALSKRIVKLAPTINKSTTDLERKMQKAVSSLEARRVDLATTDQQYIMTYTNNLALLLNELLSNLMDMQNQGGEGGGGKTCKKPGGKNQKPGAGKQLSDIISEQMQLGDGMKKMQGGKSPGGKDGDVKSKQGEGKSGSGSDGQGGGGSGSGSEGENGEYGDAEQLAKLARQQAAIRRKLAELSTQFNSKGMSGLAKELRELEQKMDKNETDIVNRKLNSELLLRQKDIQTRLLETEKSLREQEEDEKRSSKSGDDISRPVPPQLQKYITDKKQMLEQYKTVPPQLKPYYRDMVENYFQIIGNK